MPGALRSTRHLRQPSVAAVASTLAYYEAHATEIAAQVNGLDTSELRSAFQKHLPTRGHILDAGCGTGRDARAFLAHGFRVTCLDTSAEMAHQAELLTGQTVHVRPFDRIRWRDRFDGVWACASLHHLPRAALDPALRRLDSSLKPGGIFYASFRYGDRDVELDDGRFFSPQTERRFGKLAKRHPGLRLVDLWISEDARSEHCGEFWLNVLLRKRAARLGRSRATAARGKSSR